MASKGSVLIVDNDQSAIGKLRDMLRDLNYKCSIAHSGEEGLNLFSNKGNIGIVFLEHRLRMTNGASLLSAMNDIRKNFIAVTTANSVDISEIVESIKLGSFDYLIKPISKTRLELFIESALKQLGANKGVALSGVNDDTIEPTGEFITNDKHMLQMLTKVKNTAQLDSSIAISGESGTGKELVAKMIHKHSPRYKKPFIAINCAALTEELLGSSLFGFERGAFTGAINKTAGCFEEANGGTLFLDEVAEMSPKLQASVLRVIQEKEFCHIGSFDPIPTDFRLVTATNKDLLDEVKLNNFREDLFYRLSVIPIHISPLRDRKPDITLLLSYFIKKINMKLKANVTYFSVKSMDILQNWHWPGNCRELENAVEHIVATNREGEIDVDDLPLSYRSRAVLDMASANESTAGNIQPYSIEKSAFEKRYLERALFRCDGNVVKMAEMTKIQRSNLYLKLKYHNLK
ncbi:MAG TPA: sigma-54-dependent Fis family transcriptional regulator [Nitrospirae bacterium]|nr:sigma-54-dependent Fis family transcriptional regulator [Nitrospirota bacterium]